MQQPQGEAGVQGSLWRVLTSRFFRSVILYFLAFSLFIEVNMEYDMWILDIYINVDIINLFKN